VKEAMKELLRELENRFGYSQYQITVVENELQKMTKKMATTIDFTQRLLKYSTPTEVMVFKPLLDSRLKGFINFNTDASSLAQFTPVEVQALNLPQARQAIFHVFNSMHKAAEAGGEFNNNTSSALKPPLAGGDISAFLFSDSFPQQSRFGNSVAGNPQVSTLPSPKKKDYLISINFRSDCHQMATVIISSSPTSCHPTWR